MYQKKETIGMNDHVIYVGHRGGRMYGAVENTKEAFLSGVKAGCKALECDVRVTKDGVLIISHDPDLKRLTDKSMLKETMFMIYLGILEYIEELNI